MKFVKGKPKTSGKRKGPAKVVQMYPSGYYTALMRAHDWPPSYTPSFALVAYVHNRVRRFRVVDLLARDLNHFRKRHERTGE